MYFITTRTFPPENGGMQILMGGLANALSKHGFLKVFAEKTNGDEEYDKQVNYEISRISGLKILRKYRKANLIKDYLKNNQNTKVIIADHWKSLENINSEILKGKKTLCLIHSKEINHPVGTILNRRMIKSFQKADFIISNSNYTKELAIKLNINNKKIKVINPGVKKYEKPTNENINKARQIFGDAFPKIITVARFDKRKNHEKVIMIIRNLKEKFPKIKYLCIGYGKEENNLIKLVKELNIENHVIFKKNIDNNLKSSFLKTSNIFVMPSIIYKKSVEGFGISFIEAAQQGVACIGGKDGGASDAIIHEKTGLICDGNDLNSIYKSITYILENDRYKKFGENAIEFSKQFDWDLVINKYLEILD